MSRRFDAAAARVYGAALCLTPRAFRRRYGGEMRSAFEERLRDEAGHPARLALLAREIADLACAAVVLRRRPARAARPDEETRPPMETALLDVRYALRLLRRQPGFTLVATLTLALGIGANTAVFTVVNAVLLRPLPYRDAGRIAVLLNGRPGRLFPWLSPLNYQDVSRDSGVFTETAAYSPIFANLTGRGEPRRIEGADVSWNFFSVMGVSIARGRAFSAADADAGAGRVVVVSEGLWKSALGGAPEAIGATIAIDGVPRTVVGIAPAEVAQPRPAQFWEPLVFKPRDVAPPARGAMWVMGIGRLKAGVTIEGAERAVDAVGQRLASAYPNIDGNLRFSTMLLQERVVRDVRPALLALVAAVTLVLLIACVNVANLLLARAQVRLRETAVRAALGAGTRRLVQQFLSESVLLGLLGSACGLFVAWAAIRGLVALAPPSLPRLAEIAIDRRVLAFTAGLAFLTSVIFGLMPALASAGGGTRLLATAGRGLAGGAGTRLRRALVASETALAVVLLVGAGLLIRSYGQITRVHPGFDPDRVLTFDVSLPEAKYTSLTAIETFTTSLVDGLSHASGVTGAAAVFGLPFGQLNASTSFTRRGEADSANAPTAGMRVVSPDYFRVLRIPLVGGRAFDGHDTDAAPEVAIVNEQAVRRYWPGQDPIGQTIHVGVRLASGTRSDRKTIVGIVGNVKYGGLDEETPAEIYLPYAQQQVDTFTIAVRTTGDPLAFAPSARAQVAALDPDLPIAHVQAMDTLIGASVAERRFLMLLLACFAAAAIALATIGLYGVLVYIVSTRTQEIGVRLAIGASPGDVVRLIVREGATVAAAGLAAGTLGAIGAARAMATLLFGVAPTDPATFAAVAAGLGAVALAASYLAARRAGGVDPMIALRGD
jgi:putative ABC transport system permease protein